MTDSVDFLYSSKAVRARIQQLFAEPTTTDRRVVLVAYVGSAAQAYLPNPAGLLLVCNPAPGGTSARAVRELMARDAAVRFSRRLHMKVYWSEERGCVLTSANASANALGAGGLKEAGAWFPPGVVDIDALLSYADPVEVTKDALLKLQMATRRLPSHLRPGTDRRKGKSGTIHDFIHWWNSPLRDADPWKLGWWSVRLPFAKAAQDQAKLQYGVPTPTDFLGVATGQVKPGEWLLTFEARDSGQIRSPGWLFVDLVVGVDPDDADAHEKDFPYQAVQVFPNDKYPSPPFALTKPFVTAFKKAIQMYGLDAVTERHSLAPPPKLLRLTADYMAKNP